MRTYSDEFKASIIAKMLPPNNVSVPELAKETGIPRDTLYSWRIKSRKQKSAGVSTKSRAAKLSSEDKFDIVVETASMNEAELSSYCRRKGLYPEQIAGWHKLCQQATMPQSSKADRQKIRRQANEIKQLQRELKVKK